ncbi:MAG: cytochrome b/b6 domain-containing protein [Bacillota bacterium]
MANQTQASCPRHHLPARIAHWTNLIAMAVLFLTGLDINYPFMGLMTGVLRNLHYFAGFVLVGNIMVRVYFAFAGRCRDAGEFAIPGPREIFGVIRYYLFLGPHPKKNGKYNGLQRLSYLGVVILMLAQALTGFAIAWPDGMFAGFVGWIGGLAALRAVHLLGTYVLAAFTLVHVYMVFTEDPQEFWAMFFGKEMAAHETGKGMVLVPESEIC